MRLDSEFHSISTCLGFPPSSKSTQASTEPHWVTVACGDMSSLGKIINKIITQYKEVMFFFRNLDSASAKTTPWEDNATCVNQDSTIYQQRIRRAVKVHNCSWNFWIVWYIALCPVKLRFGNSLTCCTGISPFLNKSHSGQVLTACIINYRVFVIKKQ